MARKKKPIRLAVVGGRRGGSFTVALNFLKDRLQLAAVCDLSQPVLDRWKSQHPDIATYTDYQRMLKDDVCDAVIVATPMQMHAKHAVAAMNAGKHVLSEVAACMSHREAVQLCEAVERTGMTYMMAENYTYMRPHMMLLNMVRKGVFGELTYAEGQYVHDCSGLIYNEDGSMTWRGDLRRDMSGCNRYPTHSFGPIAQWLDVGGADAIDTVYSATTRAHAAAAYTRKRFGAKHEAAREDYWRLGDSNTSIIRTKLGRVVTLRLDSVSPRPHHMANHELQGTKACFRTQIDPAHDPLVWIDGKSSHSGDNAKPRRGKNTCHPTQWDSLWKYADDFEHPRWKKHRKLAEKAGHGGGDFFELEDFVNAIEGEAPNPVDVYAAVTWTSIMWLGQKSERTGKAEKAIDYRNRK